MESEVAGEIEVINSIYEGAAQYTAAQSVVDVRIPDTDVEVRLWLPAQYPSEAPKPVKASGVLSSTEALACFQTIIDRTFEPGEVYIFSFIDEARAEAERLEAERVEHDEALVRQQEQPPQSSNRSATTGANVDGGAHPSEEWARSAEIKDRSSTFVGFAVRAASQEEVRGLRADLAADKKLQSASHLMAAWRVRLNEEGTLYDEDYDNDGESGAGSMMLSVLQMTRATNVLVIVARFFNGTHIGPDRFRHIKNCTKAALVAGKFLDK